MNAARFASAVQQGYLAAEGSDGYRATELGISLAMRIFNTANKCIAHLQPTAEASFLRLVKILARIAEAAFASLNRMT